MAAVANIFNVSCEILVKAEIPRDLPAPIASRRISNCDSECGTEE